MQHLTIDGNTIEVQWFGPDSENSLSLVLLHEGLGCVSMWKDFPEKLARRLNFRVMAYSRLGYGRSDPCLLPRRLGFMHHEALDVLPKILDIAGIERCILVGHSDGGSIALIHAGGSPHPSVKGVVTLAAHVFCESLTIKSIEAAKVKYLKGDLRQRLAGYHGNNTDCAFWGWNDVWLHPNFLKWNIEMYLPQIKVPVLAIQGTDDPYGTLEQVQSIQTHAGYMTRVKILADCGHAPHLEKQDDTLSAVTDFVGSL